MTHTVYELRSILTNKRYVGFTSLTLKIRLQRHNAQFKRKLIQSYKNMISDGLSMKDFNIFSIKVFDTKKEAMLFEEEHTLLIRDTCGCFNHRMGYKSNNK